jgi:hypothetical protein
MDTPATQPSPIDEAAAALGPLGWVIADGNDPGDPWGSAIMPAFVLNDVLADVGGRTNPTFRQSPLGADEDGFGYVELRVALLSGELTVEQIEEAEQILDRWMDRLKADGLDY